jgi:flagellar biosynthesis protein FlhA
MVTILDNFKQQNPKVVNDLIPDILPLGTVLTVAKSLLKEGVSIRDMRTILESLCDKGTVVKDSSLLTEFARQGLYRTISESIKNGDGDIPIYSLDRSLEEVIVKNMVETESGQQLSIDPQITQNILSVLNEKIEEATDLGEKMVVLCSPVVRPHFKKLTEKFIPNLIVVSHNELGPDSKIKSLGTVRL